MQHKKITLAKLKQEQRSTKIRPKQVEQNPMQLKKEKQE